MNLNTKFYECIDLLLFSNWYKLLNTTVMRRIMWREMSGPLGAHTQSLYLIWTDKWVKI